MNDEQLILLVQANDCLYNKNSPEFKLAEKKKRVWKEIAQQMNLPEDVCIKRWSCLRDRYAKEKRMESLPSGSSSKVRTRWPLIQTLEFISPYIFPRVTRCSFNVLENAPTDNLSSSESIPASPSLTVDCSLSPNRSMEATSSPNIQKCPKKIRNYCDISETDKSFMEAVESFKKVCDSQCKRKSEDDSDPLKGFGQMIVALIATMNSKRQMEAMQYITAYVMEMKLKPDD